MAVPRRSMLFFALAVGASRASSPAPRAPASGNWAAPQIRAVTKAGVLGTSPATFAPQAPLTQAALADGDRGRPTRFSTRSQTPPAAAQPGHDPLDGRRRRDDRRHRAARDPVAGPRGRPGRLRRRRHRGRHGARRAPYELDLDTTTLADGPHRAGRQRLVRRRRLRDRRRGRSPSRTRPAPSRRHRPRPSRCRSRSPSLPAAAAAAGAPTRRPATRSTTPPSPDPPRDR